jgi:hypothetical protein
MNRPLRGPEPEGGGFVAAHLHPRCDEPIAIQELIAAQHSLNRVPMAHYEPDAQKEVTKRG